MRVENLKKKYADEVRDCRIWLKQDGFNSSGVESLATPAPRVQQAITQAEAVEEAQPVALKNNRQDTESSPAHGKGGFVRSGETGAERNLPKTSNEEQVSLSSKTGRGLALGLPEVQIGISSTKLRGQSQEPSLKP